MESNRQAPYTPEDKPTDDSQRCIYYLVTREGPGKCAKCLGWNVNCGFYENKMELQALINRGRR